MWNKCIGGMFIEQYFKATYGSCTETPRHFCEYQSMSKMAGLQDDE